MKINAKTQAVLATYLRAGIAAVIALYLAGETDPKKLSMAAIAAVAGPVLKWLDPKSTEFGRGAK
jgi:uncharacterized membrane protein YgaE (UPF0421/DUF939 family)